MLWVLILILMLAIAGLLYLMFSNRGRKVGFGYQTGATALAVFITSGIGNFFYSQYFDDKGFPLYFVVAFAWCAAGMILKIFLERKVFKIT